MATLRGKTLFITGASRGIGLAIALRAARDGANIVVAAKTRQPDPRLPGTIYTAVEEINKAGGRGLATPCDIRFEEAQLTSHVDDERRPRRSQGLTKGCSGNKGCVHGSLLKSPQSLDAPAS